MTYLAIPGHLNTYGARDDERDERDERGAPVGVPCTIVLVIDPEFAAAWAATHPTPAAVAS